MTRRALIIGCPNDLEGVSQDVQRVANWLATVGFGSHTKVLLEHATRQAILDALAELVDQTEPGDAVVIYYSGHGGRVYLPNTEPWELGRLVAPRFDQFLVPVDFGDHGEFRGIYRVELTLWADRLTAKTDNVTVILDCCFSSGMVRDVARDPWRSPDRPGVDARPKRRVETWSSRVGESMRRLVQWLEAQGYDPQRQHDLRNPDVVLVVASEPDEESYVYRRPDGEPASVFTDTLLGVVEAEGIEGVTWDALVRAVAARIPSRYGFQRPQVSGPRHRLVFCVEERARPGALTLRRRGPSLWLDGGHGVGVRIGDRYRIFPLVPEHDDDEAVVLKVLRVEAQEAKLGVEQGDAQRLRAGMLAVPIGGGPTHVHCRLRGGSWSAALREPLAAVPGLGVLDQDQRGMVDFELVAEPGRLALVDPAQSIDLGGPWPRPAVADAPPAGWIDAVRRVTRGSALQALAREGGGEHRLDPASYEVEWGVVREGERIPLPRQGVHLGVGDRVYLRLTSKVGTIHASVLLLGVDRSVTLWSAGAPEGIELCEGQTQVVGSPELVALRGAALRWPEGVRPDGPRQASFVIVLSNRRVPVTAWATAPEPPPSVRSRGAYEEAQARAVGQLTLESIPFHLHPEGDLEVKGEGQAGHAERAELDRAGRAELDRPRRLVARARAGRPGHRAPSRSRSPSRRPTRPSPSIPEFTMNRALIVGIDAYPDPVPSLYGSVHDAQQVHARLLEHEDGSPNFHCDLMTSDQAVVTRAALMTKIEQLLAPGADRAVLYFAGHGSMGDFGGVLIPQDYVSPHDGIRMSDILRMANDSEVDDVLVMLDCCGSGAFGQIDDDEAVLAEGVSVLTATRPEQEAQEGEQGGFFTSLLCEALDGGAADVRGHVTVASAYAYIAESLGAWDQRPQLKVHISNLAPLRRCAPAVPVDLLRRLPRWFPQPHAEFPLDPSYEPKQAPEHPEHEAIFGELQTCRSAKLIEPVGTPHMYYAALENRSCRLTPMGRHYWHMVTKNLL